MASAFQSNAFQASPAFQIEAVAPPVVEGPRGAWISDERVNRKRRRAWERQREAELDLREALDELLTGKPSQATLKIKAAQQAIELALLENAAHAAALDPELLALRAKVAALKGQMLRERNLRELIQRMQVMEEIDAQEEAGIVALLMAI